jgi:hypothetical protein
MKTLQKATKEGINGEYKNKWLLTFPIKNNRIIGNNMLNFDFRDKGLKLGTNFFIKKFINRNDLVKAIKELVKVNCVQTFFDVQSVQIQRRLASFPLHISPIMQRRANIG